MIHIFILNNNAGNKDRVGNIREKLASRNDIKYFIFNTMEAGNEMRIMQLIKKYFPDERIRVYACGGSGTMRNVFEGAGDALSRMEFAFFPCGLSNDFLKAFPGGEDAFRSIDDLIDGKVVHLDYMKTSGGICLNSVSAGVDVDMSRYTDENKAFAMISKSLPYLLGSIQAAVESKAKKLLITVDEEIIEANFGEVFFANGPVLGGNINVSEDKNITDGIGSAILVANRSGVKLLPLLSMLIQGDFDKFKKQKMCYIKQFSKIEIRDLSGGTLSLNLDGEIQEARDYWSIEIVRQGLPFVIPKGMQYDLEGGRADE